MKILPRNQSNEVCYAWEMHNDWEHIYYIVTDKDGNKFRKEITLLFGDYHSTEVYPIPKETAKRHEDAVKELGI